jgi:small-conductance mechanosensitive channel
MTIIFVKLFMFAWWLLIVSKTIGVYKYFAEVKKSLMSLAWQVGETTISIASIFDFFIIIFGTWFFVKLVNIILQVEIFSRFKFPRGFPTAITTVLNYTIVISGGMIALMSLGVTTEQFTLVFGALGVGIGFGLRNIIANFISGIIMVFERPIQIGDTIEINNILGKVQAIGTRSSTIKTFDGSEVIIPNADFIAKDITNWTLSDERRRKTLSFKVALESDIDEVLKIMKSVAVSHKDVLKDPQPLAVFVSFGEYYLEFKLYFWLDENLIVAPSDIVKGVYILLKEKNIQMPIPKQHFIDKGEK